ncbi:MAG: HIRAN domain-containing protein [Candidatus Limnocylindrales bacterium]
MSFLRKLLTGDESEQPAAQPVDLGDRRGDLPAEALKLMASGGSLSVVGESHYRDAIELITGGPTVEGIKAITWGILVAEHDNPYDPHAVGVIIDGRKVGHLAREDAAAFWPLVGRIQAAGRVAYCRADIYGGWNTSPSDRGDYRVTLYASGPAGQADLLARAIDGKSKAEIAAARPAISPGSETGPGTLRGHHHSAWHAEVDRLRDIGDQSAAVDLLLEIVDATEAEAHSEGFGVAPAAYETLAVIYRQRKDKDGEVAILERFAHQRHAPGASPPRLLERLARLTK